MHNYIIKLYITTVSLCNIYSYGLHKETAVLLLVIRKTNKNARCMYSNKNREIILLVFFALF